MLPTAIRALLTDPSLCPVTAGLVGERVHQAKAPQGTPYPLVVFHVVYDTSNYHMTGSDNLRRGRLQLDCQASTQAQANELAEAIIAEAGGFQGRVGGSPPVNIRGLFHNGGSDDTGTDMLNAGPVIGLKRIEFDIHVRR